MPISGTDPRVVPSRPTAPAALGPHPPAELRAAPKPANRRVAVDKNWSEPLRLAFDAGYGGLIRWDRNRGGGDRLRIA